MAQRKSSPPNRPANSRPGGPASGGSAAGGPAAGGPIRKPPPRGKAQGKSIVNQKQTPWGLIAVTVAVAVFAAAIVIVVIATHKSSKKTAAKNDSGCTTMIGSNQMSYLNELSCAKAISGVTWKAEPDRNHVTSTVTYNASPPVGGNHSQLWANCTGNVYATQIANENAVHMLEHGAVWVTYNPTTLSASGLAQLKTYVAGVDRMALSPYAGLKTPISLQAWGYQLFVQKASDPRIATFIKDLKYNPKTTPEPGASCSDPYFKPANSTPGKPQFTPGS